MEEKSNVEGFAYIGRCRGCKRLVYAGVDRGDEMTEERRKKQSSDIAKLIKDGFQVERVTIEEVRKSEFSCQCELNPDKSLEELRQMKLGFQR